MKVTIIANILHDLFFLKEYTRSSLKFEHDYRVKQNPTRVKSLQTFIFTLVNYTKIIVGPDTLTLITYQI